MTFPLKEEFTQFETLFNKQQKLFVDSNVNGILINDIPNYADIMKSFGKLLRYYGSDRYSYIQGKNTVSFFIPTSPEGFKESGYNFSLSQRDNYISIDINVTVTVKNKTTERTMFQNFIIGVNKNDKIYINKFVGTAEKSLLTHLNNKFCNNLSVNPYLTHVTNNYGEDFSFDEIIFYFNKGNVHQTQQNIVVVNHIQEITKMHDMVNAQYAFIQMIDNQTKNYIWTMYSKDFQFVNGKLTPVYLKIV